MKGLRTAGNLTLDSVNEIASTLYHSPTGISQLIRNSGLKQKTEAELKSVERSNDTNIDNSNEVMDDIDLLTENENNEGDKKTDISDTNTIFEEQFYYLIVKLKEMCLNSPNQTFRENIKNGAKKDAQENNDKFGATSGTALSSVNSMTLNPMNDHNNKGGSSNTEYPPQNQNQNRNSASSYSPSKQNNINANENLSNPIHLQDGGGLFGFVNILNIRIGRMLKNNFDFNDKGYGVSSTIRSAVSVVGNVNRYYPLFMEHEARITLLHTISFLKYLKSKTNPGQKITEYIGKNNLLRKNIFVKEFNDKDDKFHIFNIFDDELKTKYKTLHSKDPPEILLNKGELFNLIGTTGLQNTGIDNIYDFYKENKTIHETLMKIEIQDLIRVIEVFANDPTYFTEVKQAGGKPIKSHNYTRRQRQKRKQTRKQARKGGAVKVFPSGFRNILLRCFNYGYQKMVDRLMKKLSQISDTKTSPAGTDIVYESKKTTMSNHLIDLYSRFTFAIVMGLNRCFFSAGNWMLPVGATPHLILYSYIFGLYMYNNIAFANDPTSAKLFIQLNGKIMFKTLLPLNTNTKTVYTLDDTDVKKTTFINPYTFTFVSNMKELLFIEEKTTESDGSEKIIFKLKDTVSDNFTITYGGTNTITFNKTNTPPESKTITYLYNDELKNPIFFAQKGIFVGSIHSIEIQGQEGNIRFKKWKYNKEKTKLEPGNGNSKPVLVDKYFDCSIVESYVDLNFTEVIPYAFQYPNYYKENETKYKGSNTDLEVNHVHAHYPLDTKNIENIKNTTSDKTICAKQDDKDGNPFYGLEEFNPGCEYAVDYIYLGKISDIDIKKNIARGNDILIKSSMFNEFITSKPKLYGVKELYKVVPVELNKTRYTNSSPLSAVIDNTDKPN